MTGKYRGIKTSASGILFDNVGDGSTRKPRGCHRARFIDRPEDWAALDTCRVQPRPQGLDRASDVTPCNRDCSAHSFLIGLAAADRDQHSGFRFLEVGNVQRYQLRTAERARE